MRKPIHIFMALAFCITLLFASGCSSFLNIGHETFRCQGDENGGRCGEPEFIYRNKEQLMKEGKKEVKKEGEDEKSGAKKVETINIRLSDASDLEKIPVPVRRTEQVQRILIEPFTDAYGNKIDRFWVYTVIKDGEWLEPDGSVLR